MPQIQNRNSEFSPAVLPLGRRGTLCAIQTPRFKTARLSLLTVLPQSRKVAVLAPLMTAVLRRGCEGYPNLSALDRRLDELWGTSLGFRELSFGDRKIIGVTVEFIDPAYLPGHVSLLPDLLDLIRRVLFCPLLDEEGLLRAAVVEDEKRLQCDEIESLVASPRRYAVDHATTFFFGDRPCAIPLYGSVEETKAVTPRELTEFWKNWCDTSFFSCYYVGASKPDEIAQTLLRFFPVLANGSASAPTSFLDVLPPPRAERVRRKEEFLPIGQGHLVLYFQTGGVVFGDDRATAVQLAKEILGGSPVSLLFMNVREKLSLCYSISASFLRSTGALNIRCALNPANREKAEREILLQVERLQKGEFTDAELDAARKSLAYCYRTVPDNPSSMEHLLLRCNLTGSAETPEELIDRVQSLSRERVIEAANLLSLDTVYFLSAAKEGGEDDEDA